MQKADTDSQSGATRQASVHLMEPYVRARNVLRQAMLRAFPA